MYERARQAREASLAAQAEMDKYASYGKTGRRGRGPPPPPEILRAPEDIKRNPKYQGQTAFMAKFVPLKCKDERTLVTPTDLREWILAALIEEDPYAKQFDVEISKLRARMAEVDKQISQIPRMLFLNPDGSKMIEEDARAQREELFDKFGNQRVDLENEIEAVKASLAAHIEWRRKMGIEFTKGEIDKNTDTASWMIRLYGTNDAQQMEELLVRKKNWPGILLAAGRSDILNPLPPWAGRGEVPDGSKQFLPDYRQLQINVQGARFMRVPQGVGLFQKLDRASSTIADTDFGMFYGDFDAGQKNGYGVDITDAGVFSGGYVEGFRRGRGRLDLPDGTTIVGPFGVTLEHELPQTSMFRNPYLDGEPNGLVEINFGDGGYYRGDMVNGRIDGRGDYQSALNEVMSGHFCDGLLHGDKIFTQNYAGDVKIGKYRYGELHGEGTFMNARGDSYTGYWEHGIPHGRGFSKCHRFGTYRGYHLNGLKHGKGSLEFHYVPPPKKPHLNPSSVTGSQTSSSATANSTSAPADKDANKPGKQQQPPQGKKAKTGTTANSSANPLSSTWKAASNSSTTEGDPKANQHEADTKTGGDSGDITATYTEFRRIFQGFMYGDNLANSGSVLDNTVQMPTILSKWNRRSTQPVLSVVRKQADVARRSAHLCEKYTDMEHYLREEIRRKKIRIFNQQKHYTKEILHKDTNRFTADGNESFAFDTTVGGSSTFGGPDRRGGGAAADDASLNTLTTFNSLDNKALGSPDVKLRIRRERLEARTLDKHMYKKAVVPRLRMVNNKMADHLSRAFERIQPDEEDIASGAYNVNDRLVKLAMSDFEEVNERHRFLKYDLIWQRAEEAFASQQRRPGN